MRGVLLATSALVALVSFEAAQAADLRAPVKAAPPMARPACAQFGGAFIGIHGAANTHSSRWNDRDAWARNEFDANLVDNVNGQETGWGVGAQIGYNIQSGCTLFGFEADWTWTDTFTQKYITDGDAGAALDTLTVNTRMNWYGTLRTKTGVVVDNLLIYVTGGLAYANIGRHFTTVDTGVSQESFAAGRTNWGWTVGVGTEYQFGGNWSLKSEALYASFGERERTFTSAVAAVNGNNPTKRFEFQDSMWIARIGLNYRFGGPAAYGRY
jgi:outer membrane immunogenic protein